MAKRYSLLPLSPVPQVHTAAGTGLLTHIRSNPKLHIVWLSWVSEEGMVDITLEARALVLANGSTAWVEPTNLPVSTSLGSMVISTPSFVIHISTFDLPQAENIDLGVLNFRVLTTRPPSPPSVGVYIYSLVVESDDQELDPIPGSQGPEGPQGPAGPPGVRVRHNGLLTENREIIDLIDGTAIRMNVSSGDEAIGVEVNIGGR